MKRLTVSLLLATLFIAHTITSARAQETNVPRFEAIDCPFALPLGEKIRCGFLIVPENRSVLSGPTIKLGVAIISSHAPQPAPDPIFLLNGGPGGSLLSFMSNRLDGYAPYLATRDVVMFDQRGAGWSQPALNCPETKPIALAEAIGQSYTLDQMLAMLSACRDRLQQQGIDLTAYNTLENAADVEDLRRALGYDQINLFGVSYGTMLGQVIVRDYPQHIRSAILDSAYPLWNSIVADSAASVSHQFDVIFTNCAADVICNTLYPDLPNLFAALADRFTREPVTLSDRDQNAQAYSIEIDAQNFIKWLIYTPPAQVPALLYDLHDGNYEIILRTQRSQLEALRAESFPPSPGMKMSMMCALNLFYATPDQLAQAAARYRTAAYVNADTQTNLAACAVWPAHAIDPRDQVPFTTTVPLLVVGGEYDPSSPPEYASAIAARSTHGTFFIMPNAGHGALVNFSGCGTGLALAFINDPQRELDLSCVKTVERTHFSIRAATTRWPIGIVSALLIVAIIGSIRRGAIGLRTADRMWTWPMSLRLIGVWPIAISAITIAAISIAKPLHFAPLESARVIESIVPLIAGIHAALLFSPEDEPALEVTLACPRPLAWTILERVTLTVLLHSGLALIATLFLTNVSGESLSLAIARWFAPMLVCVGLGVCLTLIVRQAILSVMLIVLVWFGLLLASETLVSMWPYLWPIGLFLQPDRSDFALNRAWLSLIGLSLIALASINLIRDPERVLLGKSKQKADH